MPRRAICSWMLALAMACGGSTGPQDDPAPVTSSTTPTVEEPGICDPHPAFHRNQCMDCHGEEAQGGLDLRRGGLSERLVGVPAMAQGCEGRLLIDPVVPENSQLLRVMKADDAGRCVLEMPPGPLTVSSEDQECIAEWVRSFAVAPPEGVFEATPLTTALSKVKRLTTGEAPTSAEIARVQSDPAELREMVGEWTRTDAFRVVTQRTLAQLLQVEPMPSDWEMIDGIDGSGLPEHYGDMLAESVARTAWSIIEADQPITELYRTERWAVTTAMLVMMRFADQKNLERLLLDGEHSVVTATGTTDWSEMVETGVWRIRDLPQVCFADPLSTRALLHLQWGYVDCRGSGGVHRFPKEAPLLFGVDDQDWRFVEFERVGPSADLDEPPFYDVAAWREHGPVVRTRLARTGFMTTPAFLNNWETNPDNQFRVTTNQMLIVALGSTFSRGEPTVPATLDGLNEAHADPTSSCYGCHRQLDPMRGYFSQHFNYAWRVTPTADDIFGPDSLPLFTSAFAFGGVTQFAGDIDQLGDLLADHPAVATAWTQKLCWIANGEPCKIDDPEFVRVAEAFEDSGFDYPELVIELFSSPLVTGLEPTATHPERVPVLPQRPEHWCNQVERRGADSCGRLEVGWALDMLPSVEFARARVDPIVPQTVSVFGVAGLELACRELSTREVGPGKPFDVSDPDTALPRMVTELAGLAPSHERYDQVLTVLREHLDEVGLATSDPRIAMESAYVVACSSPDALALGL